MELFVFSYANRSPEDLSFQLAPTGRRSADPHFSFRPGFLGRNLGTFPYPESC